MIESLYKCHNCDNLDTLDKLTELGPDVYECDKCWKTTGGEEFTTDKDKLDAAYNLVLANLTDVNAHTIAALLEWQYYGKGNDDLMLKAYKAAQLVIYGTQ